MSSPTKYLSIDEEGYPIFDELRVNDPVVGRTLLENIKFSDKGYFVTQFNNEALLVEAFDQPYVAQFILKPENNLGWRILLPYGLEKKFNPNSLAVDEWDRFHGLTFGDIPFVMSRKAQAHFFDQLDEYDDESIILSGKKIPIKPFKPWTELKTQTSKVDTITPALLDMLPRLKIPKSKVLVLGCGTGCDSEYLAEQGHFVTTIDPGAEVIQKNQEKYQHLKNLNFIRVDILNLPTDFLNEFRGQFDLIFEHSIYSATQQNQKNKLIKIWTQLLADKGHLLAVFFCCTEWELRERLKKHFQFIFWGRWRQPLECRKGKELLVYAMKR